MALRQTLVGAAAIALGAALYNGAALGDEAAAPAAKKNSGQIEEITVTAEKRTEDVRDVPASISVLSGADIEASHITDITDLTRSVPDLSFSGNAGQGPGLSNLEIRGISSEAGSATVAVYLDDVSMTARNLYTDGSPEPLFFDVARVEVLRGPQGTLYGSSSMGGTIKFVTNQPDLDNWGGSVYATVSGTDHGGVNFTQNGVLNAPIVPGELALRIGAEFINNAGYIDQVSPSTGAVIAPGINTEHGQAFHLALKWQPDPTLTVTPALWYQRVSTGDVDNSYLDLPLDETAKLVREPGNDRLVVPSVTVNKDIGFADVTSVSSYFYRNFDRTQDATTSDVPYLASQIPNPALAAVVAGLPAAAYLNTTVRQVSEELRIASKPYDPNGVGLPITWIAGLYYADEHTYTSDTEPVIGINAAFASFGENVNNPNDIAYGYPGDFPGESSYISNRRYDTRQYAVFGEGNYYLSPTLRVTAGLRYLYARDNLNRVGDAWYVGGYTLDASTERSYAATPKFAITWDPTPDETLYANAAKGFRLGGPNRPVPIDGETIADLQTLHLTSAPASYAPDSLWNYEIGSKSRFFDNRLSVDVTGFYIDWKNIQQEFVLPTSGYAIDTNVGTAESYGVEFDIKGKPIPQLTLGLSGGYTHATLTSSVPGLGVENGDAVEGVPTWSGRFSGEYDFPITGEFDGFWRGNIDLIGNSHGALQRTDPDYDRPAYYTVGTSIGTQFGDWEVALFAKNLLNNDKVIQKPYTQLLETATRLTPLTVGLSVSATF